MKPIRISPFTYRVVTAGALAALVTIVVTGAAVRLTGSGLGCPDWPTCANDRVVAPLESHAIIEFVNRVFTGVVSMAVILAVLGSLVRNPRRRDLTWWSLSLVGGVIGQAVLGGLTVLNKLRPEWVMAHFLVSMVLVWSAVVLYHRASQPDAVPRAAVHRDYVYLGRAIFVLASVVLFVGTMVTGSGPHGGDEHVVRLGFRPHDITKVHGALVWLLVALVAVTVWRLRSAQASSTIVRNGEVLMAALLVQGAIGYLQYSMALPPWLVLLHIAGATWVWISVVRLNLSFYERWEPIGIASVDADINGSDDSTSEPAGASFP